MRALRLALGVAVALAPGAVGAATLAFHIAAPCVGSCAAGGMADGDRLTGRVRIDTTGFVPGGAFENPAIRGFRVAFGDAVVSSANAVGFQTVGVWGATRREIAYFSLAAGTTTTPFAGDAFGLDSLNGGASTSGYCEDVSCAFVLWREAADLGPAEVASVPLPPALALALGGLAALGLVGRGGRSKNATSIRTTRA